GRVHHDDEADGDGQVGGAYGEAVEEVAETGRERAQRHAHGDGGEDPYRQVAVEDGEALRRHRPTTAACFRAGPVVIVSPARAASVALARSSSRAAKARNACGWSS